jgi:uncharacterized protein YegL
MDEKKRPGGEISARPLHFFWIVDCSGSMSIDGKIQELNTAIKEALPHMKKVADENPNADVFVRALKFSSGAQWHVSQPTALAVFEWSDLTAEGLTDMGRAFSMIAEQLKIPPMTDRALPPVLVLLSDGHPTDNYKEGLKALMAQPWGKKAVRVAIAIGRDADEEVLQEFIGHPEFKPLRANNPETLAKQIRWVSTAVLKAASAPSSQVKDGAMPSGNIPIPEPPAENELSSAEDVW